MSKLTHSEAGQLGAERTKEVWCKRYRENPSYCFHCGQKLPYKKRKNKFCNNSCSASYNNIGVRRHGKPTDKTGKVGPELDPTFCAYCKKPLLKRKNKFCGPQCKADFVWHETKLQIATEGVVRNQKQGRRYLTEVRGHRCEICGLTEWRGKSLPMVLDHIDGNADNNKLTNLRLVCSNCDSQLPTYKGRNKGKGRYRRRMRYKKGKSF